MFEPTVYAEKHHIEIFTRKLKQAKCFAYRDEMGECVVHDINAWETEAERRYILTHELAHLQRENLYSLDSPYETVERIENRTEKKTIRMLIPKEELQEAVEAGNTEAWQLAEYFDLPEILIKKAVSLYTHGNLITGV